MLRSPLGLVLFASLCVFLGCTSSEARRGGDAGALPDARTGTDGDRPPSDGPSTDTGALDSGPADTGTVDAPRAMEMVCTDGTDDDGDALVDCLDPDCDARDGCEYGAESTCGDGRDNDGDALADCVDPDCDGVGRCESPERTCNDGVDNDGDSLIDCHDPSCDGMGGCEVGTERTCGDGVDNDVDGRTDCLDTDCATVAPCELAAELTCNDGFDNDVDGATDCADMDCGGIDGCPPLCLPGMPIAPLDPYTGATGTTAGYMDHTDGTCLGVMAPDRVFEIAPPTGATSVTVTSSDPATTFPASLYVRTSCGDISSEIACDAAFGTDRGAVTFPVVAGTRYFVFVDGSSTTTAGDFRLLASGDLSAGAPCDPARPQWRCPSAHACVAGVCTPAACADGMDNDGDGRIDYPFDPGCTAREDADETNPVPLPQCADGIDNDGDGTIDYPMDTGCTAASDNDESCTQFGMDASYIGCVSRPSVLPCDDIRTTGTAACSGDDCVTSLTLPFTFTYYGVGYTSWSVGSNGKTGPAVSASYSNSCTLENLTIAPFWDDLYPPSGGSVRYQTLGAAPNRRFVVQWNIPHITSSATSRYDIRAMLHEGTNRITFCYVDTIVESTTVDSGASATVGIKGTAGTGFNYSCNMPLATDGTMLEFFPR